MKTLGKIAVVGAGLAALYYLTIGILYFIGFRAYRIPTVAMQPTIQKDEMVFGRLSDNYRDAIQRFDIIVFTTRVRGSEEYYTKRVIGLPGEWITTGAKGVSINGQSLVLPTAMDIAGLLLRPTNIKIPENAVFVLGDNTSNSADSRYLGPISKTDVIGHIVGKK